MSDSFPPQIKHVVLLRLENRSLDNLLGWLYSGTGPAHVYPAGSSPSYHGLLPDTFSNPLSAGGSVQHYPVTTVPGNLGINQVFRAPSGSAYPFDHASLLKTVLMWAGSGPTGGFGPTGATGV